MIGPHIHATPELRPDRSWRRDLLILLLMEAVLGTVYLKTVPRFYNDDAWLASLGDSLAREHTLRHPIIHGWGGMHVHFVQNQVVLPVVCAVIFRLFGFGIVTGRLGSVLFAMLAIVGTYGLTRRLFGGRQAFWAAAALIIHPWFFEVSRRIRPEVYYIGLAAMALWCLTEARARGSRGLAILAGLLAGWASLSHPSGVLLAAAVVLSALLWAPGRGRTLRALAWTGFGFLVAVLPYVIYVVWAVQDPNVDFWAQMSGKGHVGLGEIHTRLTLEIRRWRNFFQWPRGWPLATIALVAWAAAWVRSKRQDKLVATVALLFPLLLPFFSVNPAGRYLAATVPWLAILLVRFIFRAAPRRSQRDVRRGKLRIAIVGATALVYVTMSLGAVGLMFYRLRDADVTRVLDRIASVTGPDARVYGDIMLWMGRDRYNYGPFPIDRQWKATIEMIRPFDFDYVVRGAWNWGASRGVSPPPMTMPPTRANVPYDLVAERYGTKVDEFCDPHYGMIEIYKIDWSRPNAAPHPDSQPSPRPSTKS